MPGRKIPLVNGEVYHVLNRGVASQPTFINWRDYKRAIETMIYYQNLYPPLKYSQFLLQARKKREESLAQLRKKGEIWAEIIGYCFMPRHFHFLLKQKVGGGVSKFVGDFANSYTRYFNARRRREGPLFKGKFQAIRVETDEQLNHLSRYIHLNPYSCYVVKTLKELVNYPYSSFPEYLGRSQEAYCHKEIVLKNLGSKENYQKFVFDQADYQRSLEALKHLWLEK